MGFILLVVSIISSICLGWLGFLFALRWTFKKGKMNAYFRECAVSIDQTMNVVMSPAFNCLMIKKEGHKFGDRDETISSVFGRNQVSKTLTRFGRFWNRFLNKLEKDHSINSIGQ